MALALDEPLEDDQVESAAGFDFVINKDLLKTIGGVSIDVSYMGFTVQPEIPLNSASGCSSCATGSCSV